MTDNFTAGCHVSTASSVQTFARTRGRTPWYPGVRNTRKYKKSWLSCGGAPFDLRWKVALKRVRNKIPSQAQQTLLCAYTTILNDCVCAVCQEFGFIFLSETSGPSWLHRLSICHNENRIQIVIGVKVRRVQTYQLSIRSLLYKGPPQQTALVLG